MERANTRRIVLLGKTGAGKSSLTNTTLGDKVFKIGNTAISETKKCQAETKSVNGRSITLIDTPGFFDTNTSEEEMKPEILKCITECAPGPHAFLIVLKVEKYTEHEQDVIEKILQYFSEEFFKYAAVVFTHGDQLDEGQKIEDYFCQNKLLSDVVKKCGGRCHVIDNKYWDKNPQNEYRSNRFQVEELLNTIEKMVMENNGGYYTNDMLQAVEEEIKQEEEHIRLLPGNMSEKEIREQAKGGVFKRLLIRLAGIGTGALLGALCGLVVPVALVVVTLKRAGPSIRDAVIRVATGEFGAAAGAIAAGGAAAVARTTEGAAAAGAAAARGAAAPITLGRVAATCAAVGAAKGGVKGYKAAEGADTAGEAAKRAAEAVKDGAISVVENVNKFFNRQSQLEYELL